MFADKKLQFVLIGVLLFGSFSVFCIGSEKDGKGGSLQNNAFVSNKDGRLAAASVSSDLSGRVISEKDGVVGETNQNHNHHRHHHKHHQNKAGNVQGLDRILRRLNGYKDEEREKMLAETEEIQNENVYREQQAGLSEWAQKYKNYHLATKVESNAIPVAATPHPRGETTEPSPYSQWRLDHLRIREGLEKNRRQQHSTTLPSHHRHHSLNTPRNYKEFKDNYHDRSEPASITDAVIHAVRVKEEADCKFPKPRVIHVQDVYPHPGKSYVPHCTILHRCSDDTACCKQTHYTCTAKSTERVELTFYTILRDQSKPPYAERLTFSNHTECECRDKLDEMVPRDDSDYLNLRLSDGQDFNNITNEKSSFCECPSAFTRRILSDGSCTCDCFDQDSDCLLLKRGHDLFSSRDKWCIQSGRCEVPACSYGPYIHIMGRCSRRKEMNMDTSSWTKYLP